MIFGRRNQPEPIARQTRLAKLGRADDALIIPEGWQAVVYLRDEIVDVLPSGPRPLDSIGGDGRALAKNSACCVELITARDLAFDLVAVTPQPKNLSDAPPIELTARVVIDNPSLFAGQHLVSRSKRDRADRHDRLWARINAELNDILPVLGPAGSAEERMSRLETQLDAALERGGMRLLALAPRGAAPDQVEAARRREVRRHRIEQQLLDQMLGRQMQQQRTAMLNELREQELFAARQLEDLETALAEDREDHALAREHFKARLALLNEQELNMLRLDHIGQRSRAEQAERLERERAEHAQDAAEVDAALRWRAEKRRQDTASTPSSRPDSGPAPVPDAWSCAICARSNKSTDKFCIHCGTKRD